MKRVFSTKDVSTPKQGYTIVKDSYWLCEDGNTEKALYYGTSAQRNRDKRVVDHLLETNSLYKDYQGTLSVVFIETAFVPPVD